MRVWKGSLFVITRAERKLLIAADLQGLDRKVSFKPHPSFGDCRVKKMAFGQDHLLILTEEGVVFGIGSNNLGQLGLTKSIKIVSNPLLMGNEIFQISVLTSFIEESVFIEDISCGANFSLFLSRATQDHPPSIFAAGQTELGELGFIAE